MPIKKIKIKINGKTVSCNKEDTVLKAAKSIGVSIPSLCQHDDFDCKANCRVCVVEMKGKDRLQTSCSTPVVEGMEVTTNSEKVRKSRKMNLELILSPIRTEVSVLQLVRLTQLLKQQNSLKILLQC